jgi:hypothetical protein
VAEGKTDFADVAGKAHVDWLHHCSQQDYEANVEALKRSGVMSLFGDDPPPERSEIDRDVKNAATRYLEPHLADVIDQPGSFVPVEDIETTYGDLLGRARETHLRSALKVLIEAGRVDGNATGAFRSRAFRSRSTPI